MIARTLCLLGIFCVSHGASDNDIWAEHEAEFETPASALAVPPAPTAVAAPAPTTKAYACVT